MNQAIKRKWVKALRSGEYAQCTGALYSGGAYCCLGVLHEITQKERPPELWALMEETKLLLEWGLEGGDAGELAKVNDAGVPFDMIAGLIDEAL